MQPFILVSHDDFDSAAMLAHMTKNRSDIGAVVSFIGFCRDEGKTLQALELEHYPGMAETQLARIATNATERWPLQAICIVHRSGLIKAGEQIVFVATASQHRQAAFEAAEFIMDYLKSDAPFWKKEHLVASEPEISEARSSWVEAKSTDAALKDRWQTK